MESDCATGHHYPAEPATMNTQEISRGYETVLQVARALTGSSRDVSPEALVERLLSAWGDRSTQTSAINVDVSQIMRAKEESESVIQALEDACSLSRREHEDQTRRAKGTFWATLCACGGWRKPGSVGVDTEESAYDSNQRHRAIQDSALRSLEDKTAVLEFEVARLEKQCAADERMVQELSQKNRRLVGMIEHAVERDQQHTTLIAQLRVMVERYKQEAVNAVKEEAIINVDRAVIALLETSKPKILDPLHLQPFERKVNGDGGIREVRLKEIGSGLYGQVVLARLQGVQNPVAIKRPVLPPGTANEEVKKLTRKNLIRFRKEALACKWLSGSHNFPKMYGTVNINQDVCIVTEFIGDRVTGKPAMLSDVLHPMEGCPTDPVMPSWNLVAIAEDVLKGVLTLHRRRLLHNDIKEDNILLDNRGYRWRGVIIDLGLLSTMVYPFFSAFSDSQKEARKTNEDYHQHIAPEILLGKRTSVTSDVYSVGYMLKDIGASSGIDDLLVIAKSCTEADPTKRPQDLESIIKKVAGIRRKMQEKEREDSTHEEGKSRTSQHEHKQDETNNARARNHVEMKNCKEDMNGVCEDVKQEDSSKE